jgi:putative chitinase
MNLAQQIVSVGCGAPQSRAAQWLAPIQAACDKYAINTPLRVAAFLAECGVESAYLTAVAENLNYSAAALQAEFPHEFPSAAIAEQYARQPERIANRAYAGRNGNGDEASGDGWAFRGRALLQITGRSNYLLCGMGIDLDLLNHPELLEQPANSAMAAAWYWSNRGFNVPADAGNFLGISRAINLGSANDPGTPGSWPQRLALYGAAKKAMGVT